MPGSSSFTMDPDLFCFSTGSEHPLALNFPKTLRFSLERERSLDFKHLGFISHTNKSLQAPRQLLLWPQGLAVEHQSCTILWAGIRLLYQAFWLVRPPALLLDFSIPTSRFQLASGSTFYTRLFFLKILQPERLVPWDLELHECSFSSELGFLS